MAHSPIKGWYRAMWMATFRYGIPWQQGLWGQHGAYLGPKGPRWAPCWPHEPCYLGSSSDTLTLAYLFAKQSHASRFKVQNLVSVEYFTMPIMAKITTPVNYKCNNIGHVASVYVRWKLFNIVYRLQSNSVRTIISIHLQANTQSYEKESSRTVSADIMSYMTDRHTRRGI